MPESSVALNYPHQFLEERWWLLTPSIERDLSSFQHNVAGRLTERHPSRQGGWELGVPIIGGSNGERRLQGDRSIHHAEAEKGRALYCDANEYEPL